MKAGPTFELTFVFPQRYLGGVCLYSAAAGQSDQNVSVRGAAGKDGEDEEGCSGEKKMERQGTD